MLTAWPATNPTAKTCSAKRPRWSNGSSLRRSDGRRGEHVVAGFRADGALSIFFGADPVYHFNAAGELRRAYCDGLLFKAERGRLVSLERVRQENEVQLVRHELSDAEQAAFLADDERAAARVGGAMRGELHWSSVGQVPADADVLGRVRDLAGACTTT